MNEPSTDLLLDEALQRFRRQLDAARKTADGLADKYASLNSKSS